MITHEFKPYANNPDMCVAELATTGDTCNQLRDDHALQPPHIFPDGSYSYESMPAPKGIRTDDPRTLNLGEDVKALARAVDLYQETAANDRSTDLTSTLLRADDMASAADAVVDAVLDANGLAPTAAALTVLETSCVWVFTVDAQGPQGGDYDGVRAVHATRDGALLALFDFMHELDVDPRDTSATSIVCSVDSDDGSTCADLVTSNGWRVSYGVNRFEVNP